MWYDRDIDSQMERTMDRPIPAGRVNPNSALWFGIVLSVLSVIAMAAWAIWLLFVKDFFGLNYEAGIDLTNQ